MNKRALLTIAIPMFAFSGIAFACDQPPCELKSNGVPGDTATVHKSVKKKSPLSWLTAMAAPAP